jgi:hypothetical protein
MAGQQRARSCDQNTGDDGGHDGDPAPDIELARSSPASQASAAAPGTRRPVSPSGRTLASNWFAPVTPSAAPRGDPARLTEGAGRGAGRGHGQGKVRGQPMGASSSLRFDRRVCPTCAPELGRARPGRPLVAGARRTAPTRPGP